MGWRRSRRCRRASRRGRGWWRPGGTRATWLVSLRMPEAVEAGAHADAGRLAARLREAATPVIGRVEGGALLLDPRTVLEGEEELLLQEVVEAWRGLSAE